MSISGGGLASAVTIPLTGIGVQNFYSKATGSLAAVGTWGTNTDGSGTAPADFTTAYQIFNVVNQSPSLDAAWTVSGTGSKVIVGNGTNPVTLTIPAGNALAGTVDVQNSATLVISNTTLPTLGALTTGSTVEFRDIAVTIPQVTYGNLILGGTGTKTYSAATYTIEGNLTYDNITLDAGSASPFTTVRVNGDINFLGTVVSPADANSYTLNMGGTGPQTIYGRNNTLRLFRLVTLNANTVTLSKDFGSTNLLVGNASGGGVTLVNSSMLDLNGNHLELFASSSTSNPFVFNTSGMLRQNSNGDVIINRSGNVTIGPLRFDPTRNNLRNLVINHSGAAGSNIVQLASDVGVIGTLTLTAGILQLTGTANLSVVNPVSGGSSTSYVRTSGTGRMYYAPVTTTAFLPVGNNTYNPVTITNGDNLNWGVRVTNTVANVQPPFNTTKAVLRTWDFWNSGSSTNANLTFQYNDGDATQLGASFDNTENVQVWNYNGSAWVAASGSLAPSGTAGGVRTVTITGSADQAQFAIANVSGPLPVRFTSIRATKAANGVKVEWTNSTETDVVNYTIERSTDGRNYSAVATVAARANNGNAVSYQHLDASAPAADVYYRIKGLEVDGKITYSSVVRLSLGRNAGATLAVYPNPVKGFANLQLNNLPAGTYQVRIISDAGQVVNQLSFSHAGGSVTEPLVLNGVRAGGYTVQVSGATTLSQRFMVQ